MLKYIFACIKWAFKHNSEPNNRSKWRRMAKEISKEYGE